MNRLMKMIQSCWRSRVPPDFTTADRSVLEGFLKRLPTGFRFAVEFRHPGWLEERTYAALSRAGAGHALSDGPWIPRDRVMAAARQPTAELAYFRWLGHRPHVSAYTHVQVDRSAEIVAWSVVLEALAKQVREIYGYFNNHYEGHSPASARRLMQQLGEPVIEPDELDPQLSLF